MTKEEITLPDDVCKRFRDEYNKLTAGVKVDSGGVSFGAYLSELLIGLDRFSKFLTDEDTIDDKHEGAFKP